MLPGAGGGNSGVASSCCTGISRVVPEEFQPEHVQANSPLDAQLYTSQLATPYPRKSFEEQGFVFKPSSSSGSTSASENGVDLEDGTLYYNTVTDEKMAYWAEHGPLPTPTKNIHQLRDDLREFGYCLIDQAFSPEQLRCTRERLVQQAAGERAAGVAFWYSGGAGTGLTTHATQFVPTLVNKGEVFGKIICHDPEALQAGPLIEQLLAETVGPDWVVTSFLSIIAGKGGHPQTLHQDGGVLMTETPLLVNQMFMLDDVNHLNGGTVVVPTSHRLTRDAGNYSPVAQLPPAVSLEAPAGTVMVFDGRLLHGTGVNQTDTQRHVMVMAAQKPWMRTQDLHTITVAPDVLEKAPLKLLRRLHFVGNGTGGIEGHGQEPGILRSMRLAFDAGKYERIRELSTNSSQELLTKAYTWRGSTTGQRAALNQPEQKYQSVEQPVLFDDPLERGVVEGKGVDPRHSIIVKATQDRATRLRAFSAEAKANAEQERMSNSQECPSAKL